MKMDTITVTALIKMTHKATAANTFKRLESLTRWIYYNSCYSSYPKLMDNTKQSNRRRVTMMMCEDVSPALQETNGERELLPQNTQQKIIWVSDSITVAFPREK